MSILVSLITLRHIISLSFVGLITLADGYVKRLSLSLSSSDVLKCFYDVCEYVVLTIRCSYDYTGDNDS